MKTFKELQESLRIEEALEFHVRLDHLDRDKRLLDKVNDLLKKHERAGHISFEYETDKGVVYTAKSKSYIDAVRKDVETKPYYALVDFSESVELGEATDFRAGDMVYQVGSKLKGTVLHKGNRDLIAVKFGSVNQMIPASKLRLAEEVELDESRSEALKALEDLVKKGGIDKADFQKAHDLYKAAKINDLRKHISSLDTDPGEAIVRAISRRDSKTFNSMYPRAKAGDYFANIIGNHKESVELDEANVKKGDSVKIINAKKYDALSKPEVSGIVIGMIGSKVMVKVGSGQMNVDAKDLVKESVGLDEATWMVTIAKGTYGGVKSDGQPILVNATSARDATTKAAKKVKINPMLVPAGGFKAKVNNKEEAELEESTDAYAASLEKIANDKKLKGITPKDREMLIKLAAMMKGQRG